MNDRDDINGVNLMKTADAVIWAAEFKRLYPDSDEQLMISWFASAMMVGYETGHKE